MKIYRAVLEYNNADVCEWETWYARTSVWYSSRALAKENLRELESYLQHLRDNVFTDPADKTLFKFRKPYIEEREIHDNVVPMNIPHDNNFYDI